MSKNHRNKQRKQNKASPPPGRRLARFGGQAVPVSSSGTGRQVLYRCPICLYSWLQDGRMSHLRLSPARLITEARRLGADLEHLPNVICRLCLFQAGISSFQVDEYHTASATVGYGFDWEYPAGMHLQAAIRAVSTLEAPVEPADVPLQEDTLSAVLSWLADLQDRLDMHVFSDAENALLAHDNPAGEGRQWKALSFVLMCPPLSDLAGVVLSMALPQDEFLDPETVIAFWRTLAAAVREHITTEESDR
jgi:hypothetical protein